MAPFRSGDQSRSVGLDPGVYEIKVTVAQGGATARRTMAIEVE
jgi:hypothetical protein